MTEEFEIRAGDVDGAIDLIREIAKWCEDTNKNMWKQDMVSKDNLLQGLTAENFYVGKFGDENAAAMILQWNDNIFWPEVRENESGFIHKLCVRRAYSGQGLSKKMIDYAAEECRKKGIKYLRLDTGWYREKLCRLYERLGFIKVGKKTIGDRKYALYEMKL